MCLVRAPRHARRRAGRWYCKPVSSVVCNGEYELSGTDLLAITPLKSTILVRRRHSWVMPRRPRARDLEMPGFGRANTLNRTMAKEGTYSMMTLMRILPPTAGGGCTDAALSLFNITVFSFFVEFQNVNPTATRPTTSRPSLSKKVFEAIQFPVRESPLHDCRA